MAILSRNDFDAFVAVDQTTLTFGHSGYEASLWRCGKRGRDVNGDGLRDLVCRFKIAATGFQSGDTVGVLRFKTPDGLPYEGRDSVVIVKDDDDEDMNERDDD